MQIKALFADSSTRFWLLLSWIIITIGCSWFYIGKIETLFTINIIILLGWILVSLKYWAQRLASLLFFSAFFVFLCGRELLEILFQIRRNDYAPSVNFIVYLEIFVALATITITYSILNYFTTGKFLGSRVGRHIKPSNQISPISKIVIVQKFQKIWNSKIFIVSTFWTYIFIWTCGTLSRIIAGKYALTHGYKSIYLQFAQLKSSNSFLLLLDKIELALPLALSFCLCIQIKKSYQHAVIASYLFYLFLSLLSGQRANIMAGLIILILFIVREKKVSLQYSLRKFKLKTLGFISAFTIIIITIVVLVERIRGTADGVFKFPILSFFYQQGVSILVLKKEIYFSNQIPSDVYYSLSAFYYGFFAKIFGLPVYHGNTVNNALHGSSLSHAITYISDKSLYLHGGGVGSSYIAEIHHDFSFIGIFIGSILFAAFLFWFDRLGRTYIGDLFRFLLLPTFIWTPRGETTGFIAKLLQPSNFLYIFICLGILVTLKIYYPIRPKLKGVVKDVLYSTLANFLSMFIMGILTVLLPKFLSQTDFSLWQLYLMWAIYGGYLTIGISDGIYLRYGGRKDIPQRHMGVQFHILIIFQIVFTTIGGIVALIVINDSQYLFVTLCVFVSTALYVPRTFLTTSMQTIAAIRDYAVVVICERIIFGAIIILFLALHGFDYRIVVYADLFAKLIGLVYAYYISQSFISHAPLGAKASIKETLASMVAGTQIVIANLASLLINGVVRTIVQLRWGLSAFGTVSFAFTIANLVVSFIQAIALVFFPYIKRLDKSKYYLLFKSSSVFINIFLLGCLLLYFPLSFLIDYWLPNYAFSIKAIGLLFPMIIFEARYRLIHTTFLKALRCETYILVNNIFAVTITVVLGYIFAFYFNNIIITVSAITLVTALRCLLAELRLLSMLKFSLLRDALVNIWVSFLFVILIFTLPSWLAGISYLIIFSGGLALYWSEANLLLKELRLQTREEKHSHDAFLSKKI